MSLDAGGLAQMTYNSNNFPSGGGLGAPTSSFASRGKGSGLKRLSLSPVGENHESNPTPRTSRSHLLAGLRTAPKAQAPPASAPYNQSQHRFGFDSSAHGNQGNGYGQAAPQTAIGSTFSMNGHSQYGNGGGQQGYSFADQVLAPPSVQYGGEDEQMDPVILAQLLQTEAYLAQRQRMLQQQLLNLTHQQFQGMNLNSTQGMRQQSQYAATPLTPHVGLQNQQIQPHVQEVPGQPGLYMVINPLTGECNYVMDTQAQQQTQLSNSPPPPTPSYTNSPPRMQTPSFRAEVSSPVESSFASRTTPLPPKKTPSPPRDVEPLPPPSANAFRRGNSKFSKSIATNSNVSTPDGLKSANRVSGVPQTPMTGTFGPGQNRAGEHPIRQPRGPPPLEELTAKPTTKCEGSKNFATRQRRRAVHSLKRAGIERRGVRNGSAGSMSPVSESDGPFSMTSDNDSDSILSSKGSLSGKRSFSSLRTKATGAIGSERRAKKEGSVDSLSSSTGSIRSQTLEVEEPPKTATPGASDRMKTPMLVLTSAEKRKTPVY